jgi:hypothetical protein
VYYIQLVVYSIFGTGNFVGKQSRGLVPCWLSSNGYIKSAFRAQTAVPSILLRDRANAFDYFALVSLLARHFPAVGSQDLVGSCYHGKKLREERKKFEASGQWFLPSRKAWTESLAAVLAARNTISTLALKNVGG